MTFRVERNNLLDYFTKMSEILAVFRTKTAVQKTKDPGQDARLYICLSTLSLGLDCSHWITRRSYSFDLMPKLLIDEMIWLYGLIW
jgi:hypothetical protein